MTSPQDPFGPPDPEQQPPYGQQPGYGQQQPGYGQQPWGQQPYGQQPQGTNGMAIAAFVTAFLCSPLGIVLGFVARSQIARTGQSGRGLATAAIIISVVSMLLGTVLFTAGGAPS